MQTKALLESFNITHANKSAFGVVHNFPKSEEKFFLKKPLLGRPISHLIPATTAKKTPRSPPPPAN